MRITRTNEDIRRVTAKVQSTSEKNERFSKILNDKRQDSAAQSNVLPQNQQQTAAASNISNKPESVEATAAPTHIDQLATEIVSHISTQQLNGVHSVDIQFNSQTLAGLRVNVRSLQGVVTVTFSTPVTRVSDMLRTSLPGLRAALENKGVRVAGLQVSRQSL